MTIKVYHMNICTILHRKFKKCNERWGNKAGKMRKLGRLKKSTNLITLSKMRFKYINITPI